MREVLFIATSVMSIIDLAIFVYADIKNDKYESLKHLMLATMLLICALINGRR